MGWFGGKKKKASKKPPVLEPLGAPAAQVAPVAQPAIQPGQVPAAIPAVQAAPAAQPVAPAIQPVVEVAPVGVVADDNVVATTDSAPAPQSTGWSKKSSRGLNDIHKRLDNMMDSKGKSLEERYADRFGDDLPDSVTADSARKEYNEKKKADSKKPRIVFKNTSQLNLTPKGKSKPKEVKKIEAKTENETKDEVTGPSIGSRIGGGIKAGGRKTKAAFGSAGAAVGRGAGAVKSGIGSGASRIAGLFRRESKEEKPKTKKRGRPAKKKNDYSAMKLPELKAELKKKGLPTSGNKADLIKRLQK